jgi:thioesterase domain-containing protein
METTPMPPAAPGQLPSPADLQQYLHDHIPLTRAMQVTVLEATPDATLLAAPLAPNINHRDTVFGGSAAALATLAAWTLLHARLAAAGLPSRLVIQRNTMDYDAPIPADFTARATLQDPTHWKRFTAMLERKGRARITVTATLHCRGATVGRFAGDFVAVKGQALEAT